METLQEFLNKRNEVSDIVEDIGRNGANGINTLNSLIQDLKSRIENNDFTYTKFHYLSETKNQDITELEDEFQNFLKDLPIIKNKLSFNFLENFTLLTQRDDFVEQWNSLNNEQKTDLLFLDKQIYKIVREKIDVKEFNFLFKEGKDSFEGNYPLDISEWINAPPNSKTIFYKLRKAAQNGIHEDFFNSQEVKDAESHNNLVRKDIAIRYLLNKKNFSNSEPSWYDRIDICTTTDISLRYTYKFFQKLEDELNGYDNVKANTKLPDLLKKWSGIMLDSTLYEKECNLLAKELEGKNMAEKNKIYAASYDKYSTLEIAESMQRAFRKKEFALLVEEAKGTEFEDFFNEPITEIMSKEMPYKRIDYMFVYFREKFTHETKRKPKP